MSKDGQPSEGASVDESHAVIDARMSSAAKMQQMELIIVFFIGLIVVSTKI